jgi:enoyl-CoA hydratase
MTVRVERTGPVTTVIMSRPETRNAVDGATAAGLAAAFAEFDADETTSVAMLWGEGGHSSPPAPAGTETSAASPPSR